jgi:probable rRNA maturation factor
MEFEIDLCFKSKKWPKNSILSDKDMFEVMSLEVIKEVKADKICNVLGLSLVFVSDAEMKKYNLKSRNKDSATNVLSFPTERFSQRELKKFKRENLFLGEIIFSFEIINKESEEQNKTFQDHLRHLLIHSILHLLGYAHEATREREEMEALEISILKKFGIRNPYEL